MRLRAALALVTLLWASPAWAQLDYSGGVTSIIAGTGISVDVATGAVTVTNAGVTSLTGTANQVTVSAATGAVTLSLPNPLTPPGTLAMGANAITGTGTYAGTSATLSSFVAAGASPATRGSVRVPLGNGMYSTGTGADLLIFEVDNNNLLQFGTSGTQSTVISSGLGAPIVSNGAWWVESVSGVRALKLQDGGSTYTIASTTALSLAAVANATPVTVSGYSLTGSSALSMVSYAGTLNTTGAPTVWDMNITQTASGAATLLMAVRDGATNYMTLSKAGALALASKVTADYFVVGTTAPTTSLTKSVFINSTALASLGTPDNGTVAFCSDCDPPTLVDQTCASVGAKTGSLAVRVNGAWKCIS